MGLETLDQPDIAQVGEEKNGRQSASVFFVQQH